MENKLLQQYTDKELGHNRRYLERAQFRSGQVLFNAGGLVKKACFPDDAVFTLNRLCKDGQTVGVAVVGNEGVVGAEALLSSGARSTVTATVLVGGYGWLIEPKSFNYFPTSYLIPDYTVDYIQQIQNAAGCRHTLPQRLAKLLLMCQRRRNGAKQLALTHDLLAETLGTYRPNATNAALELKSRGLIDYTRGQITILNKSNLQKAACECYHKTL